MEQAEAWLAALAALPQGWGLLVLALSAMIEYLFPPFPGDGITVLGAVLVDAAGWSLWGVLAAVTAGSVAGGLLTYEVGRAVARGRRDGWLGRKLSAPAIQTRVDQVCAYFTRYGAATIVVNRFAPGLRAVVFVAAGLSGLERWRVALWAVVSALLWNGALVGAGALVGHNLDALLGLLRRYTTAASWALALLAVAALARWAWGRRRGPRDG